MLRTVFYALSALALVMLGIAAFLVLGTWAEEYLDNFDVRLREQYGNPNDGELMFWYDEGSFIEPAVSIPVWVNKSLAINGVELTTLVPLHQLDTAVYERKELTLVPNDIPRDLEAVDEEEIGA